MSFLPMFGSLAISGFLLGVFLCSFRLLIYSVLFSVAVVSGLLCDVVYSLCGRYLFSFMLFLFSEAAVFLTLFVVTLWFEDEMVISVSYWGGIPLVGCLLLISSSFAATLYHCSFCSGCGLSYFYLCLAMLFGIGFVCLQFFEMWESGCDLTYAVYYASCLSTVGLHFVHVLLGLSFLFYVSWGEAELSSYHVDLVVWYWHFVDYVWLFVFFVVYLV